MDLTTLLWVLLLTCLILSVSVLTVDPAGHAHDGLSTWGWGLLLLGLSYPAYGLRMVGWTGTSILLSNLLVSITLAMHTLAVDQFQTGRVKRLRLAYIWGPVGLSFLCATIFLHDARLRIITGTAVLALQAASMAWQTWAVALQGPRERGRQLLTLGTLLLLCTLLVRMVAVARHEDWNSHDLVPQTIQNITYLVTLCVILLNTMGYVLMQKEWAVLVQQDQALHDPLTGVSNRRALMEAIERGISQAARNQSSLALMMLDIDLFKHVNDQHGHQAGDQVLQEVARRISQRLRHHDVLGRFGGEEFMVMLPDTGLAGARVVAESIRCAIQETPVQSDVGAIQVTISIGLHVRTPSNGPGVAHDMIEACDLAMYAAKAHGRNRVEVRG